MTDDLHDPRFDDHMRWVGHVAGIWASLELGINMAIWELANVEREAGACITSQLFSPSSRLRVLTNLIRIRGGAPDKIAKINKFAGAVGDLGRRRNEYIHDTWTLDEKTAKVARIHVTMEGEFHFGFAPTSIEELQTLYTNIQTQIRRFDELRDEIFQSLPPWPRTQFERSRGIRSYPLD